MDMMVNNKHQIQNNDDKDNTGHINDNDDNIKDDNEADSSNKDNVIEFLIKTIKR